MNSSQEESSTISTSFSIVISSLISMSAPYIKRGILIDIPRRMERASLACFLFSFASFNLASSSGVRSFLGFFFNLSISSYSSSVKPCLLTSISFVLCEDLELPIIPFNFLKFSKSILSNFNSSSLYRLLSSNPFFTARSA